MSLVEHVAEQGHYVCIVTIRHEPTQTEMSCLGDDIVADDTVACLERVAESVEAPQLRRVFSGAELTAQDRAKILEYKVAVLWRAFEETRSDYTLVRELVKFAVFRWELGVRDIAWMVRTLEVARPGSAEQVGRWAKRASAERDIRRR